RRPWRGRPPHRRHSRCSVVPRRCGRRLPRTARTGGGGSVIHMECAVPVRASRGVAWRVLEGKVRDPERHLSRIQACEVEERSEDELLRRVRFDDGSEVAERVVLVPESEILFQFLEHPKFEGEIRHVLFEAEGGLWLS